MSCVLWSPLHSLVLLKFTGLYPHPLAHRHTYTVWINFGWTFPYILLPWWWWAHAPLRSWCCRRAGVMCMAFMAIYCWMEKLSKLDSFSYLWDCNNKIPSLERLLTFLLLYWILVSMSCDTYPGSTPSVSFLCPSLALGSVHSLLGLFPTKRVSAYAPEVPSLLIHTHKWWGINFLSTHCLIDGRYMTSLLVCPKVPPDSEP